MGLASFIVSKSYGKVKISEEVNTDIPDDTQIEDHNQAKQTMKSYLENVMETAASHAGEATAAAIEEAREVLSDGSVVPQRSVTCNRRKIALPLWQGDKFNCINLI